MNTDLALREEIDDLIAKLTTRIQMVDRAIAAMEMIQTDPDRLTLAGKGNRKERTPEQREAISKRTKQYWANRRKRSKKLGLLDVL